MLLRKLVKHSKLQFYRSLSAFHDKPLAPATQEEEALVNALQAAFREMPLYSGGEGPLSEREWQENVNCLIELVRNDNPREFLRWDVIIRTMTVTYAKYISPEIAYLKMHPEWAERWRDAIHESAAGHPIPDWRYPLSSGTLIHHAYHLARFEEKTGSRVNEMDLVFEFGGGYGGMCRLFHNLGFRGKYIIFDLPAFSVLQEYFLKSIGLDVLRPDGFLEATEGALCISDIEQLQDMLGNHQGDNKSMFVATWSISETPVNLRHMILPLVSRFGKFLIAYQAKFNEVDNIDFFNTWKESIGDVDWQDWRIDHIPNHNRYLMGSAK